MVQIATHTKSYGDTPESPTTNPCEYVHAGRCVCGVRVLIILGLQCL